MTGSFILKLNYKTGLAFASALILSSALVNVPAMANDVDQRLRMLENEMQTLNRAFYKGQNGSLNALQANADAQAHQQQMESEMRKFQGQVEEAEHESRMLRRELDSVKESMGQRLQEMEKRLKTYEEILKNQAKQQEHLQKTTAAAQTRQVPVTPAVNSAAAQPKMNTTTNAPAKVEQQPYLPPVDQDGKPNALLEYEAAFNLIKHGKYNQAQLGFETFLTRYPQHQLASNAKYWLGETHYVRGEYAQSARVFAEGFQAYPKGAKAPDNLLKLGLSLESLGKKQDACVALKQVGKEFPTGASAVSARAEKELARMGCQ